jgi:glutathione S-transferase
MLCEKGVDFELIEVDLSNKPDWFVSVSPYTKVPTVVHGDDTVWESAIVNEYIDEVFPEPAMVPSEPGRRALARTWVDYSASRFVSAFGAVFRETDLSARLEKVEKFLETLRYMENEGLAKLGANPYWMGDSVSIVDVAFWPWFERFVAMTEYRGVTIPDDCPRLNAWIAAMRERPAVKRAANPPEFFLNSYARYADDKAAAAE